MNSKVDLNYSIYKGTDIPNCDFHSSSWMTGKIAGLSEPCSVTHSKTTTVINAGAQSKKKQCKNVCFLVLSFGLISSAGHGLSFIYIYIYIQIQFSVATITI